MDSSTESNSSYLPKISKARLEEIESEVYNDTRTYLENCANNYLEYVMASQHLFTDLYEQMEKFDETFDWTNYNDLVTQAKKNKNVELEISLLINGISENVYAPSTYERLAIIYGKRKDFREAFDVCIRWFELDYWKLPNMCNGSLRLLDRLEKLERKITVANNGYSK